MRTFIRTHILIPPEQGMIPYFFLIFLIPIIILLFPINSWEKILMLLLLGVFLYAYRKGFFEQTDKKVLFTIQTIIATLFVLYNGSASLFIYIGWQFPFWPIKKDQLKRYFFIYAASLLASSAISLFRASNFIGPIEWLWISVGLGFALLSPLAAYSVEKSNRQMVDLKMTNSRLSTLVLQSERERIARDLHDHLGQSYSTISLKAELARKLIAIDTEKAAQELADIAQTSRDHLNLVRNIVSNLHEQTIASAMIETAKVLSTAQIKLITENESQTSDWPLSVQYALASIIQEATTNVIRHSQATLVRYTFHYKNNHYHLRIKDNGIGIHFHENKSHGLSGMRNRVEELNGQFEVINDSGALLYVTIPEEEIDYD
ncbi:sensor histidine kinase [Alkalibacterium iburiense]|uniref:histidine kinase n=1 Tax=Alkalibacterium iburiense TaxID=290589 RepID=A0ABN0XTK7_9LACT